MSASSYDYSYESTSGTGDGTGTSDAYSGYEEESNDYSYYSESGESSKTKSKSQSADKSDTGSYSYSSTDGSDKSKSASGTGDKSDTGSYSYSYSSTDDAADGGKSSASGKKSSDKDASSSAYEESYYSYSSSGETGDTGSKSASGTGDKSSTGSYSYSYTSSADDDKAASASKTSKTSKSSKSAKDEKDSTGSYSYSYSESDASKEDSTGSYSYSYTSSNDDAKPASASKSGKSGKSKSDKDSSASYSYSYSDTSQPTSDGSYSYSYTSSNDEPPRSASKSSAKSKSSGKSKSSSKKASSGKKDSSTGSYSYSYTPSTGESGVKDSQYDDYSYSYYYTESESDGGGKGGGRRGGRHHDSRDDSEGSYYSYSYGDDGYYSYDPYSESSEYISEFTRERLNPPLKDWFSDLPEPTMEFRVRKTQDEYFRKIQLNIKRLKEHICRIQAEEEQVIGKYCEALAAEDDPPEGQEKPKAKAAEQSRLRFLDELAGVRKQRKAYRSLLYDAITQRNNMIEAAEIRYEEEKAKDLALWALGRHREVDYFLFFLFTLQMICMLLYIVFVDFAPASATALAAQVSAGTNLNEIFHYHGLRAISLMCFAGFGFLVTFVRKFSFAGLSYGFLTAAFSVQWIVLWLGLFAEGAWTLLPQAHVFSKTPVGVPELNMGLYGATAVMISFGALVGRLDPVQYALMAVFETFFWAVNYLAMFRNQYDSGNSIAVTPAMLFGDLMGRIDPGGGTSIHVFASVFGIAVSAFAARLPADDQRERRTTYSNSTFAFFGALLLFVLFPTFNAAFAYPGTQYRVIWNTVLAMGGSVMTSLMIGRVMAGSGNRFSAFELQRAVLVGGIVVASPFTYFVPPVASLFMGMLGALLASAALHFVPVVLRRCCLVHDSSAVFATHFVPAIFGSLSGIIVVASVARFCDTQADCLPGKMFEVAGMQYEVPSLFSVNPLEIFPGVNLQQQAVNQFVLLIAALCFGLFGGLFTGLMIAIFNCIFKVRPESRAQYVDNTYFHVPNDYVWLPPQPYD